jgi:threonine dehydratase
MIIKTPLQFSHILSKKFKCNVYLKREDLQMVRSFKVRGAFNKISSLSSHDKKLGVICASAGNHAQGVAISCQYLDLNGHIFVPEQTPLQKIDRIRYFSNNKCQLYTIGNTFDECLKYAYDFQKQSNLTFIHPYDDLDVIYGQSNICKEIYEDIQPDYIIGTIGGGGLMSGICTHVNNNSVSIPKLIGVESDTSDAMYQYIIN